jgi:hypothetical protein
MMPVSSGYLNARKPIPMRLPAIFTPSIDPLEFLKTPEILGVIAQVREV